MDMHVVIIMVQHVVIIMVKQMVVIMVQEVVDMHEAAAERIEAERGHWVVLQDLKQDWMHLTDLRPQKIEHQKPLRRFRWCLRSVLAKAFGEHPRCAEEPS